MTLAGRTILVTGGTRGIGRACVLHAAAQGARVAFCSRNDGPDRIEVETAAAGLGGAGVAVGITADVSDEASVGHMFEDVRARWSQVDGVVNNAAISREQLLVSTPTEDWDAVIGANLTGAFLVAREAVRFFLDQGHGGRIVSIGTLSQFGVTGNASYSVSKGGLAGLTWAIARQYARHGIRSTMVIPGYIETALSERMSESSKRALIEGCPMRRPGSPAEVASVVGFLLSDDARGLDGETLFASGGLREVPL
jgi:3-oxoacyl-[acyl-carrier protein] reductase